VPDRKGESSNSVKDTKQPPAASKNKKSAKGEVVGCHVRQFGGGGTAMPGTRGGDQWKEKTQW
jgi:hypothetical protein